MLYLHEPLYFYLSYSPVYRTIDARFSFDINQDNLLPCEDMAIEFILDKFARLANDSMCEMVTPTFFSSFSNQMILILKECHRLTGIDIKLDNRQFHKSITND